MKFVEDPNASEARQQGRTPVSFHPETDPPYYAATPVASLGDLRIGDTHDELRSLCLIKFGHLRGEEEPDRSAHVDFVARTLLRVGMPREKVLGVLLNVHFGISESIREELDPAAAARTVIARWSPAVR